MCGECTLHCGICPAVDGLLANKDGDFFRRLVDQRTLRTARFNPYRDATRHRRKNRVMDARAICRYSAEMTNRRPRTEVGVTCIQT